MESGWRLALCLVLVSPSPDRMMIVGGYGAGLLDSVEECIVV